MLLDRVFPDREASAYLLVRQALGDEKEDIVLARRKGVQGLALVGRMVDLGGLVPGRERLAQQLWLYRELAAGD
ncbi:MAG: hypothetical protein ACXWM8_06780, partial [Candidatus Limnocylindrales bacterium]